MHDANNRQFLDNIVCLQRMPMGWTTTSWPCLTQLKTYVELCPATLTSISTLTLDTVGSASLRGRLRQRTASLDLKRGNIWQLSGGGSDARPIFGGNLLRRRGALAGNLLRRRGALAALFGRLNAS